MDEESKRRYIYGWLKIFGAETVTLISVYNDGSSVRPENHTTAREIAPENYIQYQWAPSWFEKQQY